MTSKLEKLIQEIERLHKGKSARRVRELITICEEEGEPKLSIASLRNFIQLLVLVPHRICPDIVITQDGNIRTKSYDIFREFLPNGRIKVLHSKNHISYGHIKIINDFHEKNFPKTYRGIS